jgi:glutamyl-tRNA synthetase
MRIEDLDVTRVVPSLIDAARRDLEWLGLDWDGPALLQSDRLDALNDAVAKLVHEGRAYPCVCTRSDVKQAQSAPNLGDRELRYPGTCRGRFTSIEDAEGESGRSAGLRFSARGGLVAIDDGFFGRFETDVQAEIGDFLVTRKDGAPAYQLAVVVDDAFQRVTEVVRGDDLLSSTARQYLLQEALGLPHPQWFHVPLVLDHQGNRLAKRSGALSLEELRTKGIDPRRVVEWAARTCGIDVDGPVRASDVTPEFDLSRVPKTPVSTPAIPIDAL